MYYKINQMRLDINSNLGNLKAIVKKKYKFSEVEDIKILKKSIDSRKKNNIKIVFNLAVKTKEKKNLPIYEEEQIPIIKTGDKKISSVFIVGFGPAGIFAGLLLSEYGFNPIIIERGGPVDERKKDVENFLNNSIFTEQNNIAFGEGGAGTFSDGKLYTRVKNPWNKYILDTLVRFGASEDIRYETDPHIGSDEIQKIIPRIRNRIVELGGEINFYEELHQIKKSQNRIAEVITDKNNYKPDLVLLAIGHSAKDTVRNINEQIEIIPKNFAIGLRIEHPKGLIDRIQYGKYSQHKNLPASTYKLVSHTGKDRVCYSFCMCPGGFVIPSNSFTDEIVVNGMSNRLRNGRFSNSAIVVNVKISDYYENSNLDGIMFQERIEKKAFRISNSYAAPSQSLMSFLGEPFSKTLTGTYRPGTIQFDIHKLFPVFITENIKKGLAEFNNKMHGFISEQAILTAPETRTSSPITMTRNPDTRLASDIENLYPIGEGSGYAGGIMSSAIDGIESAVKIIENYKI